MINNINYKEILNKNKRNVGVRLKKRKRSECKELIIWQYLFILLWLWSTERKHESKNVGLKSPISNTL